MSALLRDHINAAMTRKDPASRLVIIPLLDPALQVGPGTIDLRLGTEFVEVNRSRRTLIDPLNDQPSGESWGDDEHRTYVPLGRPFVLHPGQFVLGSTLEFIGLPADIMGQVLSRSSWGRLGLIVATAVTIQPGFRGILTLELVNTGSVPIVIRPGARIAQLQLWSSESPTTGAYDSSGKYLTAMGPETPRLVSEAEETRRLLVISDRMSGL